LIKVDIIHDNIQHTYDMHIKEKLIIFFASNLQMQCVILHNKSNK